MAETETLTRVYLASPRTQQQAEHLADRDVLLSFAGWSPSLERYAQSFGSILIDSGAFSVMNSGRVIDAAEYADWVARWPDGSVTAWAGLDDIRGDWRASMRNYEAGGFPTFHDSDPPGLLDELVAMARERGGWLGVGLVPPREGKRDFIVRTLGRVPDDIHIHGWALRNYSEYRRFDSFDSTNWWRSAMELRSRFGLHWLTYGECLDIQIKRVTRERRGVDLSPLPEHVQQELSL